MSVSVVTYGEKSAGAISIPWLHQCYILSEEEIYCVLELFVHMSSYFFDNGNMAEVKLDRLRIFLPYEPADCENGTASLIGNWPQDLPFYTKNRDAKAQEENLIKNIKPRPFDPPGLRVKFATGNSGFGSGNGHMIEMDFNQRINFPSVFAIRLRYKPGKWLLPCDHDRIRGRITHLVLDYYGADGFGKERVIPVQDLIVSLVFPGNIRLTDPSLAFQKRFDITIFETYEGFFGNGKIGSPVKKLWEREHILHAVLWDLNATREEGSVFFKPPPVMFRQFTCSYLRFPVKEGKKAGEAEFVIHEVNKPSSPAALSDILALKKNQGVAILMDEDDKLYICGQDRSAYFQNKFVSGRLLRLFMKNMGSVYTEEIEKVLEAARVRQEDGAGPKTNYKRSLRYLEDILFKLDIGKLIKQRQNVKGIFTSSEDRVKIVNDLRIVLIRRKDEDLTLYGL